MLWCMRRILEYLNRNPLKAFECWGFMAGSICFGFIGCSGFKIWV